MFFAVNNTMLPPTDSVPVARGGAGQRHREKRKGSDTVIANVINSTISGLIGGLGSALMSVLLAAYVLPMPVDPTHHVVGYGIGGFICGSLSGFLGVFMYIRRSAKV